MYIPWTFNKFWSNHYNNDWIRSHPKSFSSSRFTGDVAAIVERCILCFEVRWFRGLLGQPCGRRWLYLWLLTGCLKVQLYTQVYMTFRRHRHYLHIHHMFSTLLVELVDIILICIYMYGILIARGNPVWLTAMLNIHIYTYILINFKASDYPPRPLLEDVWSVAPPSTLKTPLPIAPTPEPLSFQPN